MWSKKPTPVLILYLPVPSNFKDTDISVSAVFLSIFPLRMLGSFFLKHLIYFDAAIMNRLFEAKSN